MSPPQLTDQLSDAPVHPPVPATSTYESRLEHDPRWAMAEASQFFEDGGSVQKALRSITTRLNELKIPYAVVGGMALFAHGYRRFTEDVDLLVTPDALKKIHAALDGLGYVRPFPGSKNLRDASSKVKIEFLVTGHYPGDGKPKQVVFPDPAAVSVEIDGIHYLGLPTLVDLKLASGMTNPERLRDLSDVIELIKILSLPETFALKLSDSVRGKFIELHRTVHAEPKRYMTLWRNKFLTTDAKDLSEMSHSLRAAVDLLDAMLADGVELDPEGGTSDDYVHLVTTDPAIAKKYDMHDESEFWGADEEPTENEDSPEAND